MLPTFRLTSGSEEDLLMITDVDNSTVGSSLEPDSCSPTLSKPFSLLADLKPLTEVPSNLRHLTKHRAGLPHRRPPSRFKGDDDLKALNAKRLRKSESNSNQVKDLFHPDDKPVTV